MPGSRRAPALPSADWMLEQQMRAEIEAEAWRRLREESARPVEPEPAPASDPAKSPHRTGSIILKAVVRFALGMLGAYLAFIAATDAGLGEFEIWLAVGSAFLVTLAASMFDPLRRFVHFLAETARWTLIVGFGFAVLWFLANPPAGV